MRAQRAAVGPAERTRDRLCELLRSVQRAEGLTTLHVTHSRTEAGQLADRLLVLEGGRLREEKVSFLQAPANDAEEAVAAEVRT